MFAASFHADEPGPAKFLEVMGNGGGVDLQVPPKFTDALPHCRLGTAFGPRGAAGNQAKENVQAVRIRKRPEDLGEVVHFISWIFGHICIFNSKRILCQLKKFF